MDQPNDSNRKNWSRPIRRGDLSSEMIPQTDDHRGDVLTTSGRACGMSQPGVTEVRGFAIMGGVSVLVPPDVRVECSGIGIMGGFDHKPTVISTTDPEAPVIRVTGVAIMGGVEVTVRYPGETARDAQMRLKAERKAQRRIAKGK